MKWMRIFPRDVLKSLNTLLHKFILQIRLILSDKKVLSFNLFLNLDKKIDPRWAIIRLIISHKFHYYNFYSRIILPSGCNLLFSSKILNSSIVNPKGK